MYISRLYCKKRDKGYLNNYETVETQPIIIHRLDSRRVPFKIYEVCSSTKPKNDIQTVYTNSSNTISANYFSGSYAPTETPISYIIYKDDVVVISGLAQLLSDYTFTIPINSLAKGYYELTITAEFDGYTYTKVFPLISS